MKLTMIKRLVLDDVGNPAVGSKKRRNNNLVMMQLRMASHNRQLLYIQHSGTGSLARNQSAIPGSKKKIYNTAGRKGMQQSEIGQTSRVINKDKFRAVG